MKAVSLFSNCGAGDIGYKQAGFEFKVMAELDPSRLAVALANHPTAVGVPGDLRTTWRSVVAEWERAEEVSPPDLLAACPPCQGMSSARSGLGGYDNYMAAGKDPRNLLVTVIEAVAKELKPRSIVVENVPAFLTRAVPHPVTGKPISAALLLVEALSSDYEIFPMIGDLADWGVPQTRRRSFLTLIRKGESGLTRHRAGAPFPRPTHAADWGGRQVPLVDALHELGASPLDASTPRKAADPSNSMHFVPVWSDRQYRMIEAIPPNSGKGAWDNRQCSSCSMATSDPGAASCPACGAPLLRPVVEEKGAWRLVAGFHNSSYTRMRADAPASTITTASGRVSSDKTIHPWENRVLSPYECAYLQTFPAGFKWVDTLERWGHTNLREMIGEAVPPRFTQMHGLAIRAFLQKDVEAVLLPITDPRTIKAKDLLAKARVKARNDFVGP